MLFKVTFSTSSPVMVNILAEFFPLMVNPLPLIVMFLMDIPYLKLSPSSPGSYVKLYSKSKTPFSAFSILSFKSVNVPGVALSLSLFSLVKSSLSLSVELSEVPSPSTSF